jgi:hypothetical protein
VIPLRVYFKRFSDITLKELLSSIGVYVIWDSQSKAKPTYIGEGNLLSRLAEHDDRFAEPLDGYVATTGRVTKKGAKIDGRIIEALLIRIGEETDREPKYSEQPGHWNDIIATCRINNKLKVYIDGYDPLCSPVKAKMLEYPKLIDIIYEKDEDNVAYSYDWKYRRRLRKLF